MHKLSLLIKSAFNKNQNHYYHEAFLEKCFCKQYKMLHYKRIVVSEGIDVSK